jgi:hypothetical protein
VDFVPITASRTNDNGGGDMDWGSLIMLGNDLAMQWYSVTHQNAPIPQPQLIPGTNLPTRTVDHTLLLLGVVAVAAVLLLRK